MSTLAARLPVRPGALSWLITRGRAPATELQIPHNLHFEYLNGVQSHRTASQFAHAYAERNHRTNLSWFAAYPYAGGMVIEVHEGGSGHALWPGLVAQQRDAGGDSVVSGVLETSSARKVLVEVTAWGVNTLVLPEGTEMGKIELGSRDLEAHLQPLIPPYAQYAVIAGGLFSVMALLTLLFAVLFRADSPRVQYIESGGPTPLAHKFVAEAADIADSAYFYKGAWHTVNARQPAPSSHPKQGNQHAK